MTKPGPRDIAHLGNIELFTDKFDESYWFFNDLLAMREVARAGDSVFLRTWDDYENWSIKLTPRDRSGVGEVQYRASSPEALDRLVASIEASGRGLGWGDGEFGVGKVYRFTDDLGAFDRTIDSLRADGGGDRPEHVNAGLSAAVHNLAWNPDAAARIAFLIGDAPPHLDYEQDTSYTASARVAARRGIQLYTVAASGMDLLGQIVFRQAAQYTGGRYIFLTDDSGVGNSHAEPHIPCYNVTRLDNAIVRMISVELSGKYLEAESNQVVRQVGRPNKEGKCQLSSGMLVASF